MNLLTAILTSYIVTIVITKSYIFLPARKMFRRIMWRTPLRDMFTVTSHMDSDEVITPDSLVEDDEEPIDDELDEIRTGFDFASCFLCCCAYVSLGVAVSTVGVEWWLPIWGGAYFLATQERD